MGAGKATCQDLFVSGTQAQTLVIAYKTSNVITWTTKKFDELTPAELYAILRLRTEVFVVEQACVFQDMDNKDQSCWHLMARVPGTAGLELQAYTRLVPPGISYASPSIGRVVVSPAARREGLGKRLMEKSIQEVYRLFGKSPIRIGAQLYLKEFYKAFGFDQTGAVYDEDGIDHIEMIRLETHS